MEALIVFFDDAPLAIRAMGPLLASSPPRVCVLVACPPRVHAHISRWLDARQIDAWRADWSRALFDRVAPLALGAGAKAELRIAHGPTGVRLLSRALRLGLAPCRTLDARAPRYWAAEEPLA